MTSATKTPKIALSIHSGDWFLAVAVAVAVVAVPAAEVEVEDRFALLVVVDVVADALRLVTLRGRGMRGLTGVVEDDGADGVEEEAFASEVDGRAGTEADDEDSESKRDGFGARAVGLSAPSCWADSARLCALDDVSDALPLPNSSLDANRSSGGTTTESAPPSFCPPAAVAAATASLALSSHSLMISPFFFLHA